MMLIIIILSLPIYSQEYNTALYNADMSSASDEFNYFFGIDEDTIVSVSKKKETTFDSPISSTVISKDEIEHSGATSISESLRLAPGMFICEQTNGNYDIHIRGFNMLPPNTMMGEAPNTISLVMIDGRPVFNYFSGGTLWEALPIDLNDIDRIEIVRGASSALYGPNAASGVINIITRRTSEEGLKVTSNIYGGNHQTYIANVSGSYRFGDLQIAGSGNYQKRNRFNTEYYCFGDENYYSDPNDIILSDGSNINDSQDANALYPDPDLALDKKGGNIFLTYKPEGDILIDLSGGYQSSTAQASLTENGSNSLSFRKSDTGYAHLIADTFGVSSKISYFGGKLNTLIGGENGAWKFDSDIVEGVLEYNYSYDALIITPGIQYRNVMYKSKYFGGRKHSLTDSAVSLRTEYTFFDSLRLIAALRGDKYNHPDEPHLSYQFIVTYKLNDKNIIRLSHSKAHRVAFMSRAFTDHNIDAGSLYIKIDGNPDLDLLTILTSEIGFRTKIIKNTEFDIEIFYSKAESIARYMLKETIAQPLTLVFHYEDTDTTAEQFGSTLSFGLAFEKFKAKLFGTVQKTRVDNYYDEKGNPYADYENYTGTPKIYAGCYFNYILLSTLNININGYYSDKYRFDFAKTRSGLSGNVDIANSIVVNAKCMYTFWENSSVFVNCRNVLNRKKRQFVGGDKIALLILGGVAIGF